MGFLNERHGMMLVGRTPPGTCPVCAVNHPLNNPTTVTALPISTSSTTSMAAGRRGRMPWSIAPMKLKPTGKKPSKLVASRSTNELFWL